MRGLRLTRVRGVPFAGEYLSMVQEHAETCRHVNLTSSVPVNDAVAPSAGPVADTSDTARRSA